MRLAAVCCRFLVASIVIVGAGCSGLPDEPVPLPEFPAEGGPVALPDAPERQFDFWLGEWDVRNLTLSGKSFRDSGSALARVHPVVDGGAVLEQWSGTARGDRLIGSSLRAWDPALGRWVIWLNWHGGSPAGFSVMHGARNGERLEQFPPDDATRSRYAFSQLHEDSCQWDEARSEDGGESWTSSWVMQFTRRAAPRPLDASNAPIVAPPASAHDQTRALDFLIGAWTGSARRLRDDGSWIETTARARVTTMIEGFALLQFLDTGDGEKTLAALGWDGGVDGWLSIRADNRGGGLTRMTGEIDAQGATFSAAGLRESWSCASADSCSFRRERSLDDGASWESVLEVELTRSASSAAWIDIPYALAPFPDVLSGGQPSLEQLARASREGYRTVINLRGPGEEGELEDEAERVRELGMDYVSIPVQGGGDISEENARLLAEALAAPEALPAIVHCRSGNRVGALFALGAVALDGMGPEEAFAVGRSSGLTSLVPLVRERLGLAPLDE